MWSFGALVHYFSRGEHLFPTVGHVFSWTGSNALELGHSDDLEELVSKMLDPEAAGRPSAEEVLRESKLYNRQKSEA
jgi:hypothetical protein